MKKIIGVFLISLFLTSCATPYQSAGFQGGFSNQQLSQDTYKIGFDGNYFTSADTVENYALRRAAELTKDNGYKYFVVLDSKKDESVDSYTTPTVVNTNTTGSIYASNNYGNYNANSNSVISGGNTFVSRKYRQGVIIKMLKDNRKYSSAYDADIILRNYQVKQR